MSDKNLMRECVYIKFANGVTGALNTAFDIDIPEGMAMELDHVDFMHTISAGTVQNRTKYYLVDDPDESSDPGHEAEKVVTSTEFNTGFLTSGRSQGFTTQTMDCGKTLLVRAPNFVVQNDVDFGSDHWLYCRIWFDFVKISDRRVVEIMRQQVY